jgi:hypothetical protein
MEEMLKYEQKIGCRSTRDVVGFKQMLGQPFLWLCIHLLRAAV